jgi:tetratricopeptide (TPR) repeat protein
MDAERRQELRARLLARLENHPLLRILVVERSFRLAFMAFTLVLISMALLLPRVWKVTPPGFRPVVRVRGLHFAQAWSLKRTARKAMAAGQLDQADYAWRSAVSRNPADTEALRGYLRNCLERGRADSKQVRSMITYGSWLLRLTRTNRVDAELIARVCDRSRLYDTVLYLLAPISDGLSPAGEAALLRAMFHSGKIQAFAARWEKAPRQVREAPDMPLYWAAYLVGWGPPGRIEESRKALQAALQEPGREVLVSRLEMAVKAQAGDAEGYRVSLERVRRAGEDTVVDHIVYWRLLSSGGRKEEAQAYAGEFIQAISSIDDEQKGEWERDKDLRNGVREPISAGELLRLVRVSSELGLQEEAVRLLQKQAARHGYSPEVWVAYADLLIGAKRWADLRELARQIRLESGVRDALEGYSFYLQGRAELGLERTSLAADAFEQTRRLLIPDPNLAIATAYSLSQLGREEVARDLLLAVEKEAAAIPAFWQTLFYVAYRLKDSELLKRSGARLVELRPDDLIAVNNYAAALLVARERPEEAVKLTFQVYTRNPNANASVVNHSLALLLSGRTDEAAEMLRGLAPDRLTPEEATSYYLALFEVHFNRGQYQEAWEISEKIDRQRLFPVQIQWIEGCKKRVPPRSVMN